MLHEGVTPPDLDKSCACQCDSRVHVGSACICGCACSVLFSKVADVVLHMGKNVLGAAKRMHALLEDPPPALRVVSRV